MTGKPGRTAAGAANATSITAEESAADAGLRYVSDEAPGIRRRRRGAGFKYLQPDGSPLRDVAVVKRIKALAIPPAWEGVWICADAKGHLQATGRDARGRKQYRYHPRWRVERDSTKFERMPRFGKALPKLRRAVARDLARRGLPRRKVIAAVVRLLDTSLIRVGSEEYARENRSFGLTTMRSRHVGVRGARVEFHFRGKGGKVHDIELHDRRLAAVVRSCRELPGQELFQFIDEGGERHSVGSADVNAYVKEVTGDEFTAKDFRTWAATVLACAELWQAPSFASEREAKSNVTRAITAAAERLGNTATVCRKCYVNPAVVEVYLAGGLGPGRSQTRGEAAPGCLSADERAVLRLLRRLNREPSAAE